MQWKMVVIGSALGSLCIGVLVAQSVAQANATASLVMGDFAQKPSAPLLVLTHIEQPLIVDQPQTAIPPVLHTVFFPPVQNTLPPVTVMAGTMAPAAAPADPLAALESPDIDAHHRALAQTLFSLLPVSCQSQLRAFYLEKFQNGDRGFAGRGVVILDPSVPDSEFLELGGHEILGHFFGLSCFPNDASHGLSPFSDGSVPVSAGNPTAAFYAISWKDDATRVPGAQPADFVSGYAYKAGPFEDFAESASYYVFHRKEFTERAKANAALAAKLQWFDTYFPTHQLLGTGEKWDGAIPWDVTKLEYTWAATTL